MLYINFYSGTEHSYSGENDFPHTFNNRIYGSCTGKGGGKERGEWEGGGVPEAGGGAGGRGGLHLALFCPENLWRGVGRWTEIQNIQIWII